MCNFILFYFFQPVRSSFTHFSSLKYHKLNGEAAIKGSSSSKEREIIDNIVVSSVAMKSVMWIHIKKKFFDLCWIKKFTRTSMAGLARISWSILLVQLKTVDYDRGGERHGLSICHIESMDFFSWLLLLFSAERNSSLLVLEGIRRSGLAPVFL